MGKNNEEEPVADENPYRSPDTSESAGVENPDRSIKESNTGCLILFLLGLPLLDTFGFLMSNAGPYSSVLLGLGLGGFVCGGALGAYVSVKIKHRPWWSSCRWAIYGLIGVCLPTLILFAIVMRR